jgi:hypothetical protein
LQFLGRYGVYGWGEGGVGGGCWQLGDWGFQLGGGNGGGEGGLQGEAYGIAGLGANIELGLGF